MRTEDINIRDPFVLTYENKYYMYGTRAATCWGEADGFDCYVSDDLQNWSEAIEVFHKPEGFWADKNCWAPEVYLYNGEFYMFATFKDSKAAGGTAVLKAAAPLGPFTEHSNRQVTPDGWECIDGTLYIDDSGTPYMIFVHEWVQISDGTICAVELSRDLKRAVSEPKTLFKASDSRFTRYITNANRPGRHYVTDGPFLFRWRGGLYMLWSSFGEGGYILLVSKAVNDDIMGEWKEADNLLFDRDGGHGMIFNGLDGKKYLTLHSPNKTLEERPHFYEVTEKITALW